MMTMFAYRESENKVFNAIVDGAIEATKQTIEGVKDRKAYEEMNALISENFAKYGVGETRYASKFEAEGMNVLKNPIITRDKDVRANFDAVIAQIIYATIPMSTSSRFGEEFMQVSQVGWGDTARYLISSNDLFQINEIAEGVNWGVLQPIYNDEVTVNCSPITVGTSIDFYAVASGNFDWGNFGMRAGVSFNSYIMIRAINALTSVTANLGAAYSQAGVAQDTWTTLAQRVSAANGGADVYAVGTIGALGKALPNVVGLQYGLGKEMMDKGYLDKYMGVKLLPLDNAIRPGTVNSGAELLLADDRIYFLAAAHDHPIKTVFEGDSIQIEADAMHTTDKCYAITITYRVGVAAVLGNKFGVLSLN